MSYHRNKPNRSILEGLSIMKKDFTLSIKIIILGQVAIVSQNLNQTSFLLLNSMSAWDPKINENIRKIVRILYQVPESISIGMKKKLKRLKKKNNTINIFHQNYINITKCISQNVTYYYDSKFLSLCWSPRYQNTLN